MKKIVLLCAVCCGLFAACGEKEPDKPRRTILFVIDGLASGIEQKIDLPHFSALKQEGTLFREVYLPLAAHPRFSDSYPFHSSLPNAVLMSGSVFIGQPGIRQNYIQHSFTERPTAFVLDAYVYGEVADGFTIFEDTSKGIDSLTFRDDMAVEAAKAVILADDPEFMRIHLQGPGSSGYRTQRPGMPYTDNVWHPESPYALQNQFVDGLLGDFVQWLKNNGLWDGTVLMVMGDHGQNEAGGHPPYEPGGNVTQLLVAGGGIKKGVEYDYAEIIDVAPTIAWLHGVRPPLFSNGRILRELREGEERPADLPRLMEQLDDALIRYHATGKGEGDSPMLTIEEIGNWHTTPAGANYPAFVKYQLDAFGQASGQ